MIHATAIIDAQAELAEDVSVGPYTVVGPDVTVDSGCQIGPHVVLNGPTHLGKRNRIFQFASVGEACQDKKYKGEPTTLVMGDDNVVREYVTLQRGTVQDRAETTIGDRNLFMAYVHVGHDCVVGHDTVFANNATLAGHVHIGNGVILGGFTAVHQYCRLGHYCMTAMCTAVNRDVPAFVMAQGNLARARGMNV
ncbi:MAG: acyl-ACP--UDP-N-acetylglucosamine O-acyltransferase, partial [Gammaproteobacteria bacterium]